MKIEFVESKYLGSYKILKSELAKCGFTDVVYLGSSVQFLDCISSVSSILESLGKKVVLLTGSHSSLNGQILGCDIPNVFGSVLVIGTGDFHGLAGVLNNSSSFVLNPITGKIRKLESSFNIKGRYLKFLTSKNVGIIIATKPGQYYVKRIAELEAKFPSHNYYKIMMESVDASVLEDFNYIDFFVNTACPRIQDDYSKFTKPILNIDHVLDFEK
ncbi:diphthamide synthesis protein [Candidatus Woesearchaeota archaeon]|nr:diphthamide synthesis protein [Candidatus Woesearchaeota archaeon]